MDRFVKKIQGKYRVRVPEEGILEGVYRTKQQALKAYREYKYNQINEKEVNNAN